MDFAGWVALISASFGVIILIIGCLTTKHSDALSTGVLWGMAIGACLGVVIGAGIFTQYWERRLIREGMGEYKIVDQYSRHAEFKLIKKNLPQSQNTVYVIDKPSTETETCPHCYYQFLSKKNEKDLFLTNPKVYYEYKEKQKREVK